MESFCIQVVVARPWRDLYELIWRPETFPRWASGLAKSGLRPLDAVWWQAAGPEGPVRIRFTPHNEFGVMDHWVNPGQGAEIYVPMRVIANGPGALVEFTLFRQPGMTKEKFQADADWVARDLQALRAFAEGE
jgi:hypothetical protein